MPKTYTYDPASISQPGKDRMRFELGDTMTDGQAETTYLTDEEIDAVIALYPNKWKRAKLALVESVCKRFSYEVDTKVGDLTLSLQGRADAWKQMYAELKSELRNSSVPSLSSVPAGETYFRTGMHDNRNVTLPGGDFKCI